MLLYSFSPWNAPTLLHTCARQIIGKGSQGKLLAVSLIKKKPITWWQYPLIPTTHEHFPESVLSARQTETSKEWRDSFFLIDLKHLQVTVADPRG